MNQKLATTQERGDNAVFMDPSKTGSSTDPGTMCMQIY